MLGRNASPGVCYFDDGLSASEPPLAGDPPFSGVFDIIDQIGKEADESSCFLYLQATERGKIARSLRRGCTSPPSQ
jgi:hypothetical protein